MAPEGLSRHDLVRADPAAWAGLRAARPDLADPPHLAAWAGAGRPLIVRRRAPDEPSGPAATPGSGALVPLGLPLPPADGKRRIALVLAARDLTPVAAPTLAEAAAHAPAAWRPTLDALVALGRTHGTPPRPFGGLLWQAVTGLPYLSAASDLDLLWPCPDPGGLDRLLDALDGIARAAPMRLDGEIVLPDGGGVHWREWRDAPADGSVLVKRIDGVALEPAAALRARAAA